MSQALNLFGIMMAIFVPICMLVCITGYWDHKKKTNSQLGKLQKQLDGQSTEDLEKELHTLKERIAVLERIVTDRNYDLERKIGNL